MLYAAAFDLRDGRQGFGTVTFSSSGATDFELDLTEDVVGDGLSGATRVFNHYGFEQVIGEDFNAITTATFGLSGVPFGVAMTEAMRDAAGDAGWSDFTELLCAFDGTTYAFSYGGHAFSAIAFSNGATRRLFGFAANFSGSSSTVTGTTLPSFIIQPVLDGVTFERTDGYIYEPTGISSAAPSASGMQYGLFRARTPLFRNWVQQAEPREKVLHGQATSAHPGTHQQLFEACRSVYPFIVIDGFGDDYSYLFRLRPEGSIWSEDTCKRMRGDLDDALFTIRYRAQQIGQIEPYTVEGLA